MLNRPVKIYFDSQDELIISWVNQIDERVPLGAQMCINLNKVDMKVLKAILKQRKYHAKKVAELNEMMLENDQLPPVTKEQVDNMKNMVDKEIMEKYDRT